jgi:hypothetical protein
MERVHFKRPWPFCSEVVDQSQISILMLISLDIKIISKFISIDGLQGPGAFHIVYVLISYFFAQGASLARVAFTPPPTSKQTS